MTNGRITLTPADIIILANKVQQRRKRLEELREDKKASPNIDIGSDWSVIEGTACREVAITMRTIRDLTEEEKKNLSKAIISVAELTSSALKTTGRRGWHVKAMLDNRICRREITWTLTRVPSDVTDMEVKTLVGPQLMAVYGTDRVEKVWVTNRLAVAVFIRGIKESEELREGRRFQEELEKRNTDIAWRNRKAQFSSLGAWNNGVKAEVDTMSRALDLIRKGKSWDERRLTAEL